MHLDVQAIPQETTYKAVKSILLQALAWFTVPCVVNARVKDMSES